VVVCGGRCSVLFCPLRPGREHEEESTKEVAHSTFVAMMQPARPPRGQRKLKHEAMSKRPEETKRFCACTRRTMGGSKPIWFERRREGGIGVQGSLRARAVYFRDGRASCFRHRVRERLSRHVFFFLGHLFPFRLPLWICVNLARLLKLRVPQGNQIAAAPRAAWPLFSWASPSSDATHFDSDGAYAEALCILRHRPYGKVPS